MKLVLESELEKLTVYVRIICFLKNMYATKATIIPVSRMKLDGSTSCEACPEKVCVESPIAFEPLGMTLNSWGTGGSMLVDLPVSRARGSIMTAKPMSSAVMV